MLDRIAFSLFLLVILLTPTSYAFWIFDHGPLVQDRVDPILTPGGVGPHVHTIIGASNFRPTLDISTMSTSNCSTAPVQADMSNYWAPQLYHRDMTNNSYTMIPLISVKTYYLQRDGPTNKTIEPFPAGLRMIAGDQNRTAYNESNVADRAVSFVCLDEASDAGPKPLFPEINCKYGLRAQVNFPSCWDGNATDSEDHMSHMAYPIGAPDSGDCPQSHPHKTVLLFTEWVFDVGKFDFVSGQKNWIFANGDDTGLTFHSDFVNGWQQEVLKDAVENCREDLFGNVEGCPAFVPSINRPLAESCRGTQYVDENIVGPLTALPGCNPSPAQMDASCPGLVAPPLRDWNSSSSPTSSSASPTSSTASGSPPGATTYTLTMASAATTTATPSVDVASMSSAMASMSSAIASMSSALAACTQSTMSYRRGTHQRSRRSTHHSH